MVTHIYRGYYCRFEECRVSGDHLAAGGRFCRMGTSHHEARVHQARIGFVPATMDNAKQNRIAFQGWMLDLQCLIDREILREEPKRSAILGTKQRTRMIVEEQHAQPRNEWEYSAA